jgi:hypothetical protein
MAKKKFVLRIEEKVFDSIEKWADDEFRSVNGQIEWMLQKMLHQEKRLKKESQNENVIKDNSTTK